MNLYNYHNNPEELYKYEIFGMVQQEELDVFWEHMKLEDFVGKDISEVLKYPNIAYAYALKVIKGRWEEGEDIISSQARESYLYALNVLENEFIKGEDAIAKNVSDSTAYAINVLKGRFPKGEAIIKRSGKLYWDDYTGSLDQLKNRSY